MLDGFPVCSRTVDVASSRQHFLLKGKPRVAGHDGYADTVGASGRSQHHQHGSNETGERSAAFDELWRTLNAWTNLRCRAPSSYESAEASLSYRGQSVTKVQKWTKFWVIPNQSCPFGEWVSVCANHMPFAPPRLILSEL